MRLIVFLGIILFVGLSLVFWLFIMGATHHSEQDDEEQVQSLKDWKNSRLHDSRVIEERTP